MFLASSGLATRRQRGRPTADCWKPKPPWHIVLVHPEDFLNLYALARSGLRIVIASSWRKISYHISSGISVNRPIEFAAGKEQRSMRKRHFIWARQIRERADLDAADAHVRSVCGRKAPVQFEANSMSARCHVTLESGAEKEVSPSCDNRAEL